MEAAMRARSKRRILGAGRDPEVEAGIVTGDGHTVATGTIEWTLTSGQITEAPDQGHGHILEVHHLIEGGTLAGSLKRFTQSITLYKTVAPQLIPNGLIYILQHIYNYFVTLATREDISGDSPWATASNVISSQNCPII